MGDDYGRGSLPGRDVVLGHAEGSLDIVSPASGIDQCTGGQAGIRYEKKDYVGAVTIAKQGRESPAYRLWFDDELCL